MDQDCDGDDDMDGDDDGFDWDGAGGDDCDDLDPAVHPGATDVLGDGLDANCDGTDGLDLDGDGAVAIE